MKPTNSLCARAAAGCAGATAGFRRAAAGLVAFAVVACGGLVAFAVVACGGDGPITTPAPDAGPALPASVDVVSGPTTLRISTQPFGLTLLHDKRALSAAVATGVTDAFGPAGLGLVTGYASRFFYDPAKPPGGTRWRAGHAVVAVTSPRPGAYRVDFGGGFSITASPATPSGAIRIDTTAPAPKDDDGNTPHTVMSRLCMGVVDKEVFFGFGETFDRVSNRGVIRPMQILLDAKIKSGFNEVHAPVPFAVSPRGWAMLVDNFNAGAFDVAKSRTDRICATFTTHELTAYLMTDADPLNLVERLSALKGRAALPPDWAFAPQQWRNALKTHTELLDDATRMRKEKIPGSVVWIDNPWQTGYNTFEFDKKQFPDAKGTIAKLNAMGYRVVLWSTPNVDRKETALWAEATKNGYLITGPNRSELSYPWGASDNGALVDFSAPGAVAFWQRQIKKVIDLGVDGFKLDYGEEGTVAVGGVRSPFRFHGDRTPATMHREFPRLYHKTYLDALPKGQGFLITRAGSLGEQTVNTCIWPGDLDSDFSRHENGAVGGLPAAIAGGLSLSVSGYPFYGSDIGGFRGRLPSTEVLMRWAEYAALGTIMQLGGGGKSHNPWDDTLFDAKKALPHYRRYARLHTDLFPTIYSYAVAASRTGRPVTRPLGLAYPRDEKTWTRDFTYLLGDYLLVAPVITAGATTRKVYLPTGIWVHYTTRVAYKGGAEVDVPAPLGALPLFYAAGAIVARLGKTVDTIATATDKTVVSYADNKGRLALDIIPNGPGRLTLFDGTAAATRGDAKKLTVALKPGRQFVDVRLRLDWRHRTLGPATPTKVSVAAKVATKAANSAAVETCTSDCWFYDATTAMLHIRALKAADVVVE